MPTQIGQREVFNNARRLVDAAGLSTSATVLSQSYLRSEVAMSTSTTSYHIPILVNDNQNGATSSYNTSNLLALQDAFVVSSIFIGWANPTSVTDATFIPQTYPNVGAAGTTAIATAISALYSSNLQVTVNNRQILTGWDTLRHYFVPQTQNLTATASQSVSTAISQLDFSENGFYPVEPNLVFVGSKNNQVTLNFPQAISSVPTSTFGRLIVIFRGILAQNATVIR
jgi:hypothetical protein